MEKNKLYENLNPIFDEILNLTISAANIISCEFDDFNSNFSSHFINNFCIIVHKESMISCEIEIIETGNSVVLQKYEIAKKLCEFRHSILAYYRTKRINYFENNEKIFEKDVKIMVKTLGIVTTGIEEYARKKTSKHTSN